jgi:hypothetical protein
MTVFNVLNSLKSYQTVDAPAYLVDEMTCCSPLRPFLHFPHPSCLIPQRLLLALALALALVLIRFFCLRSTFLQFFICSLDLLACQEHPRGIWLLILSGSAGAAASIRLLHSTSWSRYSVKPSRCCTLSWFSNPHPCLRNAFRTVRGLGCYSYGPLAKLDEGWLRKIAQYKYLACGRCSLRNCILWPFRSYYGVYRLDLAVLPFSCVWETERAACTYSLIFALLQAWSSAGGASSDTSGTSVISPWAILSSALYTHHHVIFWFKSLGLLLLVSTE